MTSTPQPKQGSVLYLIITGVFFLVLFIIFLFLPRPTYSELEKRDLTGFPNYSNHTGNLSGYTASISDWFSNTQPFRDHFLTMSMDLRDKMKLNLRSDEDAVSFHATDDAMDEGTPENVEQLLAEEEDEGNPNALIEENAKVANAGIIVAGNAPNARAMMAFGGGANSGGAFISTVNNYSEAFPDQNIYVVVASSPGEFYMPEKVKGRNKPETPTLENIRQGISPRVIYVNVHDALEKHSGEDIFLRTDHHWAPLGAYYAAEAFAKSANVPFKNLDAYDKHVIHGYVGSMYGYSKDITVKNSPEDFVYYTPKDIQYSSTFITFHTNKDFQVTGETKPYESSFFKTYKDGSGAAYCTFMGGDQSLVHVKTGVDSNRKLLVIKDSFGNAFPGYMFYSFSDVHVVDFRYFNRNIKKYIEDNGITDIAFVFNIFNVCNSGTFKRVNRFLTQRNGEIVKDSTSEKESTTSKEDTRTQEKETSEEAQNSENQSISVQESPSNPESSRETPVSTDSPSIEEQ